jgi:DNA-binding response OmpR family regulator
VLVLDDEFLIAIELESILSAAGYTVLSAVNVGEARGLMALGPVDVAVLDFRMGHGAAELAHELHAAGVPLLFCTGSLAEEVRAVFPDAPVLPKPFSSRELTDAVLRVLGR